MLRSSLRTSCVLALSISLAGVVAGCGDLIIPAQADGGNETDGAPLEDGGGTTDGGATDAPGTLDASDGGLDCADAAAGHPTQLGCTGLYSDWGKRTISSDAKPFDPGLHLWSDGAEKFRYVYLPPATKIDTTDLNEWKFPVGTKFWKEFRLLGKKVETRFLWKIAPQTWFRTTYEWSDDETTATEVVGGRTNVRGIGYEIPSTDVCASCHAGRTDFILGFELVSLAQSTSAGLNLAALKTQALLTNAPTNTPVLPTLTSTDTLTPAAFGFLHSNCGTACHNRSPSSFAGATGLFMRLEVDATGALPSDAKLTDTYKTSVGVTSNFTPIGLPAGSFMRVRPHDPSTSAIPYRDGRRDGVVQMPPLASHLVDFDDVKRVIDWINSLP